MSTEERSESAEFSDEDLQELKDIAESFGWSYDEYVRQNELEKEPKHPTGQIGALRSVLKDVMKLLPNEQLDILHMTLAGTISDLSHKRTTENLLMKTMLDEYESIMITIRQVQSERKKAQDSS